MVFPAAPPDPAPFLSRIAHSIHRAFVLPPCDLHVILSIQVRQRDPDGSFRGVKSRPVLIVFIVFIYLISSEYTESDRCIAVNAVDDVIDLRAFESIFSYFSDRSVIRIGILIVVIIIQVQLTELAASEERPLLYSFHAPGEGQGFQLCASVESAFGYGLDLTSAKSDTFQLRT